MGKITKNYIYNLVYQLFILLVPLVTAPYLARTLGAVGTGIYGYVYSMTSMICTIVLLGIYSYGNRQIAYVRDDKQKINTVFWQIISDRLIIAIIGTIIYFVIVLLIGKYIKLFIIFYMYLLAYFCDCTWLFVGLEDMKWAVIKNAITKILAVIGIFAFVRDTNDVAVYVFIQGGAVLISNILAYSQIHQYVSKPKLDFTNFKNDILGSFWLFLPSVAATIYTQSDKVMIELITGLTDQVSYYDYAEKIVTIPWTFITVLSTVMMPRIANEFKKNNKEVISHLLSVAANFSLFVAFPMMFGLVSVADKMVPWYLGDKFLPTIQAIIMISPIILTNTLTGISGGQYFTATNQIKILTVSQFFAAIANLIINAILIPKFGFYGAAFATAITSASCAAYQYWFLLKQVKLPGLFRSAIKYIIFSLIMFGIIKVITMDMAASPLTNVIQILIGFVVYFGLCVITKDKQVKLIKNKIVKDKD